MMKIADIEFPDIEEGLIYDPDPILCGVAKITYIGISPRDFSFE